MILFRVQATANRYKVGTVPREHRNIFIGYKVPEYVDFETPDPVRLPLPSSTYLRIHAACCKVAHMSGAADYYNMLEDTDHYDPYDPVPAELLMTRLLDLSIDQALAVEPVQ